MRVMATIDFILYLIGFILFVLAALGVVSRINLIAAGLACWILVPLLETFHTLGG